MNSLLRMKGRIEARFTAWGDRLNTDADARVAASGWRVTPTGWGGRTYRDARADALTQTQGLTTNTADTRELDTSVSLASVIHLDAARALAARTGRPVRTALFQPTGGTA